MTIYEIARKLKTPGLHIETTFKPTLLTKRLFNSARRMIATGRIEGNGGASQVARLVLDSKDVPYVKCNKWGVSLHGDYALTDAAKDEVRNLIEAYIVIESARNKHFDDDDRRRIRRRVEEMLSEEGSYLSLYMKEIGEQVANVYLANRYPDDMQKAQQLLSDFEAGKPIPVDI